MDEFSSKLCIRWADPERLERLAWAKHQAQETKAAARVSIDCRDWGVGELHLMVKGHGAGKGRDSHREFVINVGPIQLTLDRRPDASRQLYNGSFRITGSACLRYGVDHALRVVLAVVEYFGGKVVDGWDGTCHIAVDLPGVDVGQFVQAALEGRVTGTATRGQWQPYFQGTETTGVTFGRSSTRCRINVYDKLADLLGNKDSLYVRSMIDRRYGGQVPTCATRVEWQLGREWFAEFGLQGFGQVLEELAAVCEKLIGEGNASAYTLLRFTDEPVDRANRNQKRAVTCKLWARVCEMVGQWSGKASKPLARVQRGCISNERAVRQVIGIGTKLAAMQGRVVTSCVDVFGLLCEVAETLIQLPPDYVEERFWKHAERIGPSDVEPANEWRSGSLPAFAGRA